MLNSICHCHVYNVPRAPKIVRVAFTCVGWQFETALS